VCFALLVLVLSPRLAPAASADDFKTAEYWNSTGLDYINAASAYALGYTGRGIVVGMLDSPVLLTHPELAFKVLGVLSPQGYPMDDRSQYEHGTHVAGIMVAASNEVGMEGVAYNASLYSVTLDLRDGVQQLPAPDFFSVFSSMPNLKIVNNSWGVNDYPYETNDTIAYAASLLQQNPTFGTLMSLSTNYDKLMVFAAGNDGHVSPEIDAILPRYYPSLTGWLSVVCLDTAAITTNASGVKTGDVQSVGVFSNLAAGAQLFTVSAPGIDINSLDAASPGTGYRLLSGTSMAAPYVSGALALVQEAFPWMTSKQLADAVLTTADNPNNQRFTPPAYTITVAQTKKTSTLSTLKVLIHYINNPVPVDVTNDLLAYYNKNAAALNTYYYIASFNDLIAAYNGTFIVKNDAGEVVFDSTSGGAATVSFEDVFGQGILNVGLAVRGPAILDANRLSKSDYSSTYGCALYSVNTRGYTGVWSNDISQRQWDNSLHLSDYQYVAGDDPTDPNKADALALLNQNVGLLKDGPGTLILTGYNTYAGATVVRDGTLSLTSLSGVANSGTLANSNLTVETAGTLTGNGTVLNTVTNTGTFIPGTGLGSAFTVGNYIQQGAASDLFLCVSANSGFTTVNANQMLFAGGRITIAALQTYYANQSWFFNFSSLMSGTVSTAGFDWHRDVVAGWYTASGAISQVWLSPTLDATVSVGQDAAGTPTSLTLTFSRSANAYSRYAGDANSRAVGAVFDQAAGNVQGDAQYLVAALDYSSPAGSEVSAALRQLSPRQFGATTKAALGSQRDLTKAMLGRLAATATEAFPENSSLSSGDATGNAWRGFLSPLGGLGWAGSADGFAAASIDYAGTLAGLETDRVSSAGAWTVGGHLAFLHRNQHSSGPGENRSWTDGFHLGGQFRFVPQALATDSAAVSLFALARLGLESTTQRRSVAFDGYLRTAQSEWVSPVGSLLAGGAWNFTPQALGGWCTLGPVAWLNYSANWQPAVKEHGGQAINLKLRDGWGQSLRSNLGARLSATLPPLPGVGTVTADFSSLWNHELLGDAGTLKAHFAAFGGEFTFRNTVSDRDSLSLSGGLTATCTDRLRLGLAAGTELGSRHTDSWGSLNLGWKF
jgi:autotransporter-associated beta strand protein